MDTNLVACYNLVKENAIIGNTNSISKQSQPSAMKRGTLQLVSPGGEVIGTYQFNNGGGGRGYLPSGTYTVTAKEPLAEDDVAGMTVDGIGYKYRVHTASGSEQIPDSRYTTPRTGILIHPDGGYPGTNGCIGIIGDGSVQTDFMQKLDSLMQQNGGKYTFQFDIAPSTTQSTADVKQPEEQPTKTNISPVVRNVRKQTGWGRPIPSQQQQPTPASQSSTNNQPKLNTFKNFVQTRKQLSGRGY